MSNKSPIFPMPEPQHFSDYGFDPQMDYFQVLEEAMKHKRDTERSIDSIRFKLQKPIPKDDQPHSNNKKKQRWWNNLFKWKWTRHHHHQAFRGSSISGPVYLTGRPSSGPLAGSLSPATRDQGHVGVPYSSFREVNKEQQQKQRMSTSALPVYLNKMH